RFGSLYHVPTLDGATTNTRIALEQVRYSSKGEFRPQSSAIDVIRFWAGAVDYHHDELGIGDSGIDGVQATFNNHAQEVRNEIQFMPMATPFGALISTWGAQFDHQQIDTSGDAGSLLGQARTNRAAAYTLNELWFTDTLRAQWAARVENVRIDGTAGIFPTALVPPPDNPTLSPQALGFTPSSISFKLIKDLPSWMQASATIQRIQRAPSALELFAHASHDAPGTFEIGDPSLKIESGNSAELGLKRSYGDFRFDGKVYYTYSDLGVNDTPTSGYNLLKLQIENKRYWRYSLWGPTEITTRLGGDNLLDVDVRNSVQIHKDENLLPGRSIKLFMNAKAGPRPPAGT